MSLELIVGPPNSGRADEIFRRFRAALERQPMLVVPTGDDVVTFERELCGRDPVSLGGTIATFTSLAHEITRALGAGVPPRLTVPQREALVRAAVRREHPRLLRRSAGRPGFAPALDGLIAELQAALISPADFARIVADLEQPGYEEELARLYAAYVSLRDASGRADDGSVAEAAIAALRAEPGGWDGRPVLVYGFDDLSRAQLELIAALSSAAEVTIAVAYEDRRALSIQARLLGVLAEELGAATPLELPFDASYTDSEVLRHLDQSLFESEAEQRAADDGLVLFESAGARGEAEAIGIEIARLLQAGYEPDDIAIVVRHPETGAPLLANVLRELGLPVALEASLPLASSCAGASLIALCRAAQDEAAVEAMLAHMRLDPALPPSAVDWVERRLRRGDAQTVTEMTADWEHPPRHLGRIREAAGSRERLLALARAARELAERPHRERAPLASAIAGESDGVPFSAFELRAGVAAAELVSELASIGDLPGCEPADLRDAVAALESASVPAWRGPASGRVRILSPYRARAARVKALFVASLQDGEFPSSGSAGPLLSEERRRQLGHRDLRRADPADQERYLFFACVSRPTDRLYLSWQNCDEDGGALARSPFVDEVLDLLSPEPAIRSRGPERAVPAPDEATSARTLARALAVAGWDGERDGALARLEVGEAWSERVQRLFAGVPDPRALPGPLEVATVLDELASREVFSANSLEGWVECPYRWFVDHELSPQRLEPEADPLWLGGIVHRALELLYREPPGEDSIPRPADVGRWKRRFAELLEAEAESRTTLNHAQSAALARLRIQVEAFLDAEAESVSAFRPSVLELGFGPMDAEGEEDELRDALAIGDVTLRGRIDRIDVAPDGQAAIVRDYKTGKNVPTAAELADRGKLQIQLYMRVAQRVMGLDPVAGLYQPLGASATGKRKARGLALRDDERLDGVGIVSYDRREPDELAAALDAAEETAAAAARGMRLGLIDRKPIGGQCPKYCTFQPICRLERALGAVGESAGNTEREQ